MRGLPVFHGLIGVPLVWKKRHVFMENVMEARYRRLRGLEDEEIIRQSRRGCGGRCGTLWVCDNKNTRDLETSCVPTECEYDEVVVVHREPA